MTPTISQKEKAAQKNNKKEAIQYLKHIITKRIKNRNMSKNFRHVSHRGDVNNYKHRFYSPNNFYNSEAAK